MGRGYEYEPLLNGNMAKVKEGRKENSKVGKEGG